MTSAEVAMVAALGAAFLTGLSSLGVVWVQEWRRSTAADRDALASAIHEMLSRSMTVASRAQALADTMRVRSGLGEGVNLTTGIRKPTDMLELHDWLAQDMAPMSAAWSAIWTRGDQEMVRRANALLAACGNLIGAGTTLKPASTVLERIGRFVVGERWTDEQRAEAESALKRVAAARKALAEYSRHTLRMPNVELFGHGDEDDNDQQSTAAAGHVL